MDLHDDVIDLTDSPCKKFTSQLLEIFPDACPNYINRLCDGAGDQPENIHLLIDEIISEPDYPKRAQKVTSPIKAMDSNEQFAILEELFPDADPDYLHHHAKLNANNKEQLQAFIESTFEKRNYPTIKEQLRKQQLSAQARQYTDAFNIEEFLKVIPDPEKYFNDPGRMPAISVSGEEFPYNDIEYAHMALKNIYSTLNIRLINSTFSSNNCNVIKAANDLDLKLQASIGRTRKKRMPYDTKQFVIQNIPLLQEIAYVQHRKDIKVFLENRAKNNLNERNYARFNNLFQTCGCCFDKEVMPQDVANCESGCAFCKECVQTSVEVLFSEGKLDYPCLSGCGSLFSLQTLQVVSKPKLFSKMVQKKQLQEIKAAGIEDLESCPFCDFVTIPAPDDKIFRCMDPECMKQSCRLCKEPSHVPLRCEEVEKDDEIKIRTYIENKMTEALLRKCHKCGLRFIKSQGCNRMTCSCGAKMCYVCGKAVDDYTHFNGQEGTRFDLCPLFSDTNELDLNLVLKGAELAKAQVGVIDDASKLKFDPTIDVPKHYKEQQEINEEVIPPGQPVHMRERNHQVLPNGNVMPGQNHHVVAPRYVVNLPRQIYQAAPGEMMQQRNHHTFPRRHMPQRNHQGLPPGNRRNRQVLPPVDVIRRRNHQLPYDGGMMPGLND